MLRRRRPIVLAGGSALLALALGIAPARADGDAPAMAEALFRSGRQLMGQGDYAQACPKFAESNRIDPKLGTLLNLALCHERVGKTASAWAEYVQASQTANRLGQGQREQIAREKAAALEPGLPRVIVEAAAESRSEMKLDDQAIGPAAFATAIPVDPGEHVVRATAPGKKPFVESFVASPGATLTVRVVLADEDTTGTSPAWSTQTAPGPQEAPARPESSTRRTWGFVVGGAGVALVGVGAFFGMQAFSMKHTAEGECSASGACTQTGLDAISTMKTSETVSTVTTLAGAAALAGGVYLLLTSTSAPDPGSHATARLQLGPDPLVRGVRMELAW